MFKIGDYVVNAKNVEIISVENEREREKIYKDILKTCNPRSMVSVIKTLNHSSDHAEYRIDSIRL